MFYVFSVSNDIMAWPQQISTSRSRECNEIEVMSMPTCSALCRQPGAKFGDTPRSQSTLRFSSAPFTSMPSGGAGGAVVEVTAGKLSSCPLLD